MPVPPLRQAHYVEPCVWKSRSHRLYLELMECSRTAEHQGCHHQTCSSPDRANGTTSSVQSSQGNIPLMEPNFSEYQARLYERHLKYGITRYRDSCWMPFRVR